MIDNLDMPCFYLRNQASIALFKIDSQTGVPVAELIPSLNLAKAIKEKSNLSYSVINIFEEDENLESDLISGKNLPGKKVENEFEDEDEDSEHLDLDDLMDEMQDTLVLADKDNLKQNSMHHFKLKPRDVV